MIVADIIDGLEHVRKSGNGWTARCPAHEDKTNSLSVTEGDDGRTLLNCFAGCTVESICQAIGIRVSDLFSVNKDGHHRAETSGSQSNGVPKVARADSANVDNLEKTANELQLGLVKSDACQRYIEARGISLTIAAELHWGFVESWTFTDRDGGIVHKPALAIPHYRDGKLAGIKFRTIDGTKMFSQMPGSALNGLYGCLLLDKSRPDVLIVEGPEDCALAYTHGFNALAINSASIKPSEGDIRLLRNFRQISLVGDQDVPGQRAMDTWQQDLPAQQVNRVRMAKYKDIGEMWKADPNRFKENFQRVLQGTHDIFDTWEEFQNAKPLRALIESFLWADVANVLAGLSGQGKTLILLAVNKALLSGSPLFGHFRVLEPLDRCVYLIPECSRAPFFHRAKLFGLESYLQSGQLLVRTLTKGPRIDLDDIRLLCHVKDAAVTIDTAVRYIEGDESSASDIANGLAADVFGVLSAGAACVTIAQHSPKSFAKENYISLENCLRGSGDIGAFAGAGFGIRQIDAIQNVIHLEDIKPRDSEPTEPFQIIGRPYIDQDGDFRLHRLPGECSKLAEYIDPPARNKGGAPTAARDSKAANKELVRQYLSAEPTLSDNQIVVKFKAVGVRIDRTTILRYRRELQAEVGVQ